MSQRKYINYAVTKDGFFLAESKQTTAEILPPGIYTLEKTMFGIHCKIVQFKHDELLNLPNTTSNRILEELKIFWEGKTKKLFREFDLIYKRGILMHGKPGTGKTSTLIQVTDEVIEQNGYVFYNSDPVVLKEWIDGMRTFQSTPRVLAIYEEFEDWISGRSESDFLQLLDGGLQLDDIVYIATTNYINQIPERIYNRPSRFATVIKVGFPEKEARRKYFEIKLSKYLDQIDIDEWVKNTENLTIDHLKDIILSVMCFQIPLNEAVKKARSMESIEDDEVEDNF